MMDALRIRMTKNKPHNTDTAADADYWKARQRAETVRGKPLKEIYQNIRRDVPGRTARKYHRLGQLRDVPVVLQGDAARPSAILYGLEQRLLPQVQGGHRMHKI